jgi:hypothetical protein
VNTAKKAGHGVAVASNTVGRVVSHLDLRKLGAGIWEFHDTVLLAGAAVGITYGCFLTDAASGGLVTAALAVPCGIAIASAGTGAYFTGRQMVRDFKKAYRR